MLRIISISEGRIFLRDHNGGLLIMRRCTLDRGKKRAQNGGRIRRPVIELINGSRCVFTRNEMGKAREAGECHLLYVKGVPELIREEILDKIKMSKKLARGRALRLKLDADRSGANKLN
jgi:hypothetical protein